MARRSARTKRGRARQKPFVIAPFIAFAVFPVAVVLVKTFPWPIAELVVGGLCELGEPARKALIVDFAPSALRARVVGLYYLCRSMAIAPAAFVGGLLWRVSPELPFFIAGSVGIAGVATFVTTVEDA